MRHLLFLALLALVPVASAQNASADELPVGTGAPGPEESIEGLPGFFYGTAVVIATLAVTGVLIWVTWRQRVDPPPEL